MTPTIIVPASEERFFNILKMISIKMNIYFKDSKNFFK
jgi:hypothetical protein